jgi:hypothetical protein
MLVCNKISLRKEGASQEEVDKLFNSLVLPVLNYGS